MHLMEGAPEPVDAMHGPVPDIDQQLINQHGDAGADKGIEPFQVEELVPGQRVAPEQGQVGRQEEIEDEHDQRFGPPALHPRQGTGGEQCFQQYQGTVKTQYGQGNGIHQDLQWRRHAASPRCVVVRSGATLGGLADALHDGWLIFG